MPTAVIVDAVRTAGGKRNGKLSGWHPADLAAETPQRAGRAQQPRPRPRRGRDHGLRHAGRRPVGQRRPQRRAGRRLARGGPRHHHRPPVRLVAAGRPLRRPGRHGRRPRHRGGRRRRGHEPGADGRLGRRRQLRLPVRPPGRPALRRRRRPRAAGHLGRADRRQVGPQPARTSTPSAAESQPRAARARAEGRFENEIVAVRSIHRDKESRRHHRVRRAGHRRRGHPRAAPPSRRSPTSSRRSSPTARSRPATPARSPTAPRPR